MGATGLARVRNALAANRPAVFAGVAMAGVVATAVFSARGSIKAKEILDKTPTDEPKREVLRKVLPAYLPAIACGAATVGCIAYSTHCGLRGVEAALDIAGMSETRLKEYVGKATEVLGEKKAIEIKDAVAQDILDADPVSNRQDVPGSGKALCYDGLTGRYFMSDMETVRHVQNDVNARALNDGFVPLNDIYYLLGLDGISYGDDVGYGWDRHMNRHVTMELEFSSRIADDGRPCLVIEFDQMPVMR